MIVLLFILGVGSAASHHFYYRTLHNTSAGDATRQQWVIQIGTALAFLSNAALVSVVAISRTQWVWVTLRKRFITVAGIDALFGVTADPMYFRNVDMIRGAKLATFMAVIIWSYPLTAVLTPGTISVQTIAQFHPVPCIVPTLAFEFDTDSTAQKLCCQDTSLTHVSAGSYVGQDMGIPPHVERVLMLAAYSGHIQPPSNVGLNGASSRLPETTLWRDCGKNCTYTVQFLGPGIHCTENTDWSPGAPLFHSALEYMDGTFFRSDIVTEGVLWVGFYPDGANDEPSVLFCRKTVTQYSVRLSVLNYQFSEPIIEAVQNIETIADAQPLYPDTRYLPNLAVFHILSNALLGNLTKSQFSASSIALTPLLGQASFTAVQLGLGIEKMAQAMVVSLLSIDTRGEDSFHPLFLYAALEATQCTTTKSAAVYNYKFQRLLYVYGASTSMALIMAVVGFVALARNGVSNSVTVSALLRTTRNPTLDRLLAGTCLGADPLPTELGELRLKFGEVRTGDGFPKHFGVDGVGHMALGVEGEVFPIRNGARYS